MIYNDLQSIYNGDYNQLQSIYNGHYNELQWYRINYNPFTMAITMIYTQLQSIYNLLQLNYNYPYGYLQYIWQTITISL